MLSLVVQLLAQRSPAELEGMRDRLRTDLNRLTVELEQVQAAIKAQRPRKASGHTAPRRSHGKASTRERVLAIVAASEAPIGPAAIKRAMEAEGGFVPQGGSLYSTVKRLTEQGELHKVADGEYTLPALNGTDAGPTENGARAPQSTAATASEGA
jgi:hypothetical protein